MKRLKEFQEGYKKFKEVEFKKNKKRFKKLVKEGQSPKVLFITCSDSRVIPDLITGSGPGDLFIVRNIGNFVPPYNPDGGYHCTAAAIEYAVGYLEVTDIIVCGHSDCGAVKELFLEHTPNPKNINIIKWLDLGKKAKEKTLEVMGNKPFKKQRRYAEKLSALMQIENLLTYPEVKEKVEAGKLHLHAWHYNIKTGKIKYFDDEKNEYRPLEFDKE